MHLKALTYFIIQAPMNSFYILVCLDHSSLWINFPAHRYWHMSEQNFHYYFWLDCCKLPLRFTLAHMSYTLLNCSSAVLLHTLLLSPITFIYSPVISIPSSSSQHPNSIFLNSKRENIPSFSTFFCFGLLQNKNEFLWRLKDHEEQMKKFISCTEITKNETSYALT